MPGATRRAARRGRGAGLLADDVGPRDRPAPGCRPGYRGRARAAFDDALAYSQERETFGKPIWQHQSVGNYLADMATSIVSARLLLVAAAESYETERRSDLEAGMAKLLASEVAMRAALDTLRIHGAYGYSRELDVERYFRDAPLMIVGEGTNEIQRLVITRQLIERGGLPDLL